MEDRKAELEKLIEEIDLMEADRRRTMTSYVERSYENLFNGINTLLNPSTRKLKTTTNQIICRNMQLEINLNLLNSLVLINRKLKFLEELDLLKKTPPVTETPPAADAAPVTEEVSPSHTPPTEEQTLSSEASTDVPLGDDDEIKAS